MPQPPPISESHVRDQLAREGLDAERWSNGPGTAYEVHDHPYGKVLIVASGSITFTIDHGERIVSMTPGDRLFLPPRTPHSAQAGPEGVVCLEAHLPPESTG